jgi:hypothetical protein
MYATIPGDRWLAGDIMGILRRFLTLTLRENREELQRSKMLQRLDPEQHRGQRLERHPSRGGEIG